MLSFVAEKGYVLANFFIGKNALDAGNQSRAEIYLNLVLNNRDQLKSGDNDLVITTCLKLLYSIYSSNGNDVKLFSVTKELAERGDSSAKATLAVFYYQGKGTSKSIPLAKKWIKEVIDETGDQDAVTFYNSLNNLS